MDSRQDEKAENQGVCPLREMQSGPDGPGQLPPIFNALAQMENLLPWERRATRWMPFCVCAAFFYQLIFTLRGIIFHPPWVQKPTMQMFMWRFTPPFLLLGVSALCVLYLSWKRFERRKAIERFAAAHALNACDDLSPPQ